MIFSFHIFVKLFLVLYLRNSYRALTIHNPLHDSLWKPNQINKSVSRWFLRNNQGRKFQIIVEYILSTDPHLLAHEQYPTKARKWVMKRVCFSSNSKNFSKP